METRFRKYLTLRRLNSAPSQTSHALDDLDLYSVPYESTTPSAKSPIFISQPLRKSDLAAKRMTDEFEGLAIRAFSYDSFLPGKPPVLGGRPYKGNGPVKLQTSRRLSSGELLTTTQDNQRTLEDILEGDYIVGGKEKRNSQLSQVKTSSPSLAGPASPRFQGSATTGAPRQPSFLEQSRRLPSTSTLLHSEASASPVMAPSLRDSPPATPGLLPPELLPPDSGHRIRSGITEPISAKGMPANTARARMPSATASLLTKGEEQNATIQALWRAEYARLVAIYGQEGVDRNIAELNRDHPRSVPLDVTDGSQDNYLQSAIMLQPLPKPSFDASWTSNSARSSQGSIIRESSIFDDASDYSSQKPSSIMSSECSSSSYTKQTSLYEPDLITTREDVRRVVENMRSNYLKAIESTTRATDKAKTKRKPRARASLPNASATGACPSARKPPKVPRQTWHGSNAQVTPKGERRKAKAKPATARPPSPRLKASTSRSSVKSRASVQRADSLTLGILVPKVPSLEKGGRSESSLGGQTYSPGQHAPSSSFTSGAPEILQIHQRQSLEAL